MTPSQQHIVCTSCGRVNRVPSDSGPGKGKCGVCALPLATDHPVDIDGAMLDRLISRDEGTFVLDVWAPWCGPCRLMIPAYAEAAERFKGQLRFLRLNSEANPQAATRLQVRGIPAIYLFRAGRITEQHSGVMTAPTLVKWLSDRSILTPASN